MTRFAVLLLVVPVLCAGCASRHNVAVLSERVRALEQSLQMTTSEIYPAKDSIRDLELRVEFLEREAQARGLIPPTRGVAAPTASVAPEFITPQPPVSSTPPYTPRASASPVTPTPHQPVPPSPRETVIYDSEGNPRVMPASPITGVPATPITGVPATPMTGAAVPSATEPVVPEGVAVAPMSSPTGTPVAPAVPYTSPSDMLPPDPGPSFQAGSVAAAVGVGSTSTTLQRPVQQSGPITVPPAGSPTPRPVSEPFSPPPAMPQTATPPSPTPMAPALSSPVRPNALPSPVVEVQNIDATGSQVIAPLVGNGQESAPRMPLSRDAVDAPPQTPSQATPRQPLTPSTFAASPSTPPQLAPRTTTIYDSEGNPLTTPASPAGPAAVSPAPAQPVPPAIPTAPVSPAPSPAEPDPIYDDEPVKPAATTALPERKAYDLSLQLYQSGRFAESEAGFEAFLQTYPNSKLTPNALYWKGETLYSRGKYAEAIFAFKDVQARFPRDPKTPDSLLKTAMCYQKLGDKSNASLHLSVLYEDWPRSEATKRARSLGLKP